MITGEGPAETLPGPRVVLDEGQPAASPVQASAICDRFKTVTGIQGPNYVAGVDAYGRAVAPADVTSEAVPVIDMPEQVDIPISINVAQTMNLPVTTEANVTPGTVRVFKDGRVLYNGQDVSGPVSAYCDQLKPELNVNVQ